MSDQPSIPARRLAERLRALREREYGQLTQGQLARALGGPDPLSIATISLWEKSGSDRLPPPQRLAAYARLFCTGRSFAPDGARLLRDDELTEPERQRQAELYEELLALRDRAQAADAAPAATRPRGSIWRFPEGEAVSMTCSDAPDPPPYADQSHLNYSQYARYADLDALIEAFGQIRADNPATMVRLLPPEELVQDFALNHLVFIGGVAALAAANYFAQDIPLPVPEATGDTHVFKCTVGDETRQFESLRDDDGALVEDVGLIARGPHPAVQRTVTMLSGITSRGVHGAALCFTDSHVRDTNARYLQDAFGDADAFCILMRVPVQNNIALPFSLRRDNVRLFEWSAATGARW